MLVRSYFHMCADCTHAHMEFIVHLDTSICERIYVCISSYLREHSSKMYIRIECERNV